MQDTDGVADLLHVAEDVAGEQDRRLASKSAYEVEDLATPERVESRGGFVEDKQLGPGNDGGCDTEPLQHPPRETTHPSVGVIGQTCRRENFVDSVSIYGFVTEHSCQVNDLTGCEPRVKEWSVRKDCHL